MQLWYSANAHKIRAMWSKSALCNEIWNYTHSSYHRRTWSELESRLCLLFSCIFIMLYIIVNGGQPNSPPYPFVKQVEDTHFVLLWLPLALLQPTYLHHAGTTQPLICRWWYELSPNSCLWIAYYIFCY